MPLKAPISAKALWLDFITSGLKGKEHSRAYLRRVKFTNALSLFGICTLIAFGLLRLTSGIYWVGLVDLLLALVLASNLVFLRFSGNLLAVTSLGLLGLLGLVLFLFITGGAGGTGILWIYFFPVSAFFLTGVRGGIVWMAVLYGSVLSLYGLSALGLIRLYYSLATGGQMLASLLLELLMVFYYARVMEKEEDLIEDHNRRLTEANQILGNEISQRKRVEEELLRISHAVRSSSDAIAITDIDGKHLYHNRAFLQLFKFTIAEVNQAGGSTILYRDPELARSVFQTIRSGGSWSGEVAMLTKERRLISALQRSDAIRDHSGAIVGLISLFTDVTAKRDSDRLQSALYQISERSSAAQDLHELYQAVHQIVGSLMYAKNMFIAYYDPAARMLSFPYFVDEFDPPPPPRPLGDGLIDYVIRHGKPLLASQDNIELLSQTDALSLMGTNCLDWLGVPLMKGGEIIGVLAVQNYTEAMRYSEKDKEILTFVSQHVASAIERRRAQDKIKADEERFRRVISSISDHIYMTDFSPDGRPTNNYISPNIEQLSGYPHQKFVEDWSFWPEQVIHPEDRQAAAFQVSVFLSGQDSQVEYRIVRADGRIIWVRDSGRAVRHQDTGAITVYGVISDITQSKYYEEVREGLLQDLKRVNSELSDFAYIVSHDLKAPLRAISSLAGWLAEDYGDKLDEEGRSQLQLLLKRTKRMHNLIEGILTYSRLGRLKPTLVRLDSNEIVRQVIEALEPPPGIEVRIQGKLPEIVYDRTHIEQLFQNLISNAVKYMGRPQGQVTVACADRGDCWEFSVSDTGEGIPPEHFDRIFKIFQTLRPRDEMESTGIGLTIVKKVVEQYAGRIWVESEVGRGSVFRFTVPKSLRPDDLEAL
jgi:PAS domain S-box-containing protein